MPKAAAFWQPNSLATVLGHYLKKQEEMMARVITFFPKQTLVGDYSTEGVHYSEIFELSDIEQLAVQMHVIAYTWTGAITAEVEETSDPSFRDDAWAVNGTGFSMSVAGTPSGRTFSGLKRFVRAKISVPSGRAATIFMEGVARSQ